MTVKINGRSSKWRLNDSHSIPPDIIYAEVFIALMGWRVRRRRRRRRGVVEVTAAAAAVVQWRITNKANSLAVKTSQ